MNHEAEDRLAALEFVRAGLRHDRANALGILHRQDAVQVSLSLLDLVVLLLRASPDAEHFLDVLVMHELNGQSWADLGLDGPGPAER